MPRHGLRRFCRHGMFPQLMVFEAVARLGSVTRAAEELHLAQPTVSTQLKKLAQSLDLALFEQQGRGLVLTHAGRELQHQCIELFGLLECAEARLTALRSPRPEMLRVAAVPATRQSAARLVAAFCSRYPGVQASLHVEEHLQLVERMAKNQDDVYLLALAGDAPGNSPYRQWSLAHASGCELAPLAQQFVRDVLLDGLGVDANNPSTTPKGGNSAAIERRPQRLSAARRRAA
ncbi:MAG TPA: LysR family transcriptional regulator [Burkholderiales bacterium]|nr:LysR family transcriptional regulator [Burkholderiales bacterium]